MSGIRVFDAKKLYRMKYKDKRIELVDVNSKITLTDSDEFTYPVVEMPKDDRVVIYVKSKQDTE